MDYGWGWNLLSDKYEVKVKGKGVTRKYESRAEYHRGVWLAWRSYIARGSRWVVPEAGKSIDPKTFESLGIIVLSNNNQFNTCRIAQEISRVYWGPLKKDNIMNNFNCGNGVRSTATGEQCSKAYGNRRKVHLDHLGQRFARVIVA